MRFSHGEGTKHLGLLHTFQPASQTAHADSNRMPTDKLRVGDKPGRPTMTMERSQRVANKDTTMSAHYSSGRGLTLKQLKETVDEIYESKVKFDEKNFQGKLGRETMNQYLFTYLNQKYGLKSLTI